MKLSRGNSRGTARLLAAVQELAASADVAELAAAAARVAEEALQGAPALVLLRGAGDATYRGGGASASADLEAWADELVREGTLAGVVASRGKLAAPIQARAAGFQGVVAVSELSSGEDEARAALMELGRLVSSCLAQIAARGEDSVALGEARAALAKGLHDLRTPLNSLRLGMHLLGPALAGQDQSVVDRTHRAIDRMAALVTEMFESLQKPRAD